MGSNQILILVDGIRLNNATYRLGNHPYLTWVDPFTLGQIEVVRGPASVLYGSDALGGTINLVTRRLDDAENGMHIRLAGRVASADREKTSRLDFNLNPGKVDFITGITYQDFGDLARGTN